MYEYLIDKFYEIKSSEDVDNLEELIASGASEQELIDYMEANI
jgi:hypothetical protein